LREERHLCPFFPSGLPIGGLSGPSSARIIAGRANHIHAFSRSAAFFRHSAANCQGRSACAFFGNASLQRANSGGSF
jgi:hypothetical protein